MTKNQVILIFSLLALTLSIGHFWKYRSRRSIDTTNAHDIPSVNSSQIDKSFLLLSAEKVKLLVSKANSVELGAKRADVVAIMGKADQEKTLYQPEMFGKSQSGTNVLMYFAARQDRLAENTRDLIVYFIFDGNDDLRAVKSNIPGISEKTSLSEEKKQ